MNESYLVCPPHVFIACPLFTSVMDQLIIMSLHKYLKPSADSGGTNSKLELLPYPNTESGESARAVIVAAANKEVVAVLSGTTNIYYNTCFTVQTMKSLLLTLLLHCISN